MAAGPALAHTAAPHAAGGAATVAATATARGTAPATAPVAARGTAQGAAPATVPVAAPATAPVAARGTAQGAAPATVPVAAPATAPVAARGTAPGWLGHHPRRRRPQAQLWITVRQAPHGPVLRWTLRCGPDGGRLPHPDRACARLSAVRRPFAPVPHGTVCPMIDYGPQTAAVTGLWHGVWISARFSRANGCEETRWNKVIVALGLGAVPGQVNPGGPMQPSPPGPMQVNPGGPMRPAPPGPTH